MKARRGVALLAALWLVVAIATVALQFSLEARERRTVGILTSERGIQRAAALGALALTEARLERALRVAPTGSSVQRLRSSDPWMDVDSVYSGSVLVDSMPVDVVARDLGEKLNIDQANETELQTFFSFLLGDYSKATQLAQAIMDWRDADSIPRPSGAERDAYIKAGMLALPTNTPFRDVDELQHVMGMTAETYAAVAPYLTTRGTGAININSAPVPVLRALPGMTDATLNRILQLRSQGRRIENMADVFPSMRRGGRRLVGQLSTQAAIDQFAARATLVANEVELTIIARAGPQAPATRLTAIIARTSSTSAAVRTKLW
ncbi:MAG TPA: type II secretion system protein GspK [Gemmatimonadaceae bacterium]|nr:type II secretion system protein GspK [Gemmatimonadaceae bacterium]